MALIITGIGDKGNLKNERIGFRMSSKGNLKYFVVFTTAFNEAGFYNRSEGAFWFAPEEVNVGDRVILYTTSGADSFQENEDGTKTYFKYWGFYKPIFSNEKDGVVIAEVDNWSSSKQI